MSTGFAKPLLSARQIVQMNVGFLGLQFSFGLQQSNMGPIYSYLGADEAALPLLSLAGPMTGLLVQPIVGAMSDRTASRYGRRTPYFLIGAICTTLALFFMPNSPTLWIAAGLLWILDASINISMEPFRAFVGDKLSPRQRPSGYAMQSFFIGVGAVVASMLPWILAHFGVANTAEAGQIPDTVKYAFYGGGVVLFLAVGWTVWSTREYSPQELAEFDDYEPPQQHARLAPAQARGDSWIWIAAGLGGAAAVNFLALERDLYLLCGLVAAYGLALLLQDKVRRESLFATVMADLHEMPDAMRKLALVQFFSWFALFAMWIFTTAAVTNVHFGSSDTASAAYNDGANWVGVLFAAYNGFAALAAIVIPWMARRIGLRMAHLVNVWLGALGLASFLVIRDPDWLLLSMVGVGAGYYVGRRISRHWDF